MDYKAATDRLISCPELADLAREIGVGEQMVKQARLDPSASGYRKPPAGWQEAVVRVAERQAAALLSLAREVRRTA